MKQEIKDPEQLKNLPELNVGDLNACKYEVIDGNPVFFPCLSGKCFPLDQQKWYCEFLCMSLNEHLHFDGSWRVVLRDPVRQKYDPDAGLFRVYVPTKIECQFLDGDGDVQFVVAMEHRIESLIKWGLNHTIDMCAAAYKRWRDMMSAVDVREDQMIKAAKGQKSSDPQLQSVQD